MRELQNERGVSALLIISTVAIVLSVLTIVNYILPQSTITSARSNLTLESASVSATPVNLIIPSQKPSPTAKPTSTPTPTPRKSPMPTFVRTTPVPPNPQGTPFTYPLPELHADTVLTLINDYRSEHGKPKLAKSSELCRYANNRADYLIANNMSAYLASENGHHAGLAEQTKGYSGHGIGENLAGNVVSDQEAVLTWQQSPGHNELLLATDKEGVAITQGCAAVRVRSYGSLVVFLAGDK